MHSGPTRFAHGMAGSAIPERFKDPRFRGAQRLDLGLLRRGDLD